MNTTPDIISVSQYLDKVNFTLKDERAKILGEVSGLQMYEGRSYLYFSIKDSKDGSTIKCFMWKNDYRISGVQLREGLELVVTAYPEIYKPNGGLSLQVKIVELVGEGALKLAYDELKKKLELEGLFLEGRKRAIPEYPHKIGLITSKSGAVINDFLTNIGKFGFEIVFVDSKVEGQDAITDLHAAIRTLRTKDIDVLVLLRGGGSLESFQAFNNESLVREIASFPVPVLTGIGHDKDIPLVSLVSDKNVSTPTAVANLLSEAWADALAHVRLSEEKIFSQFYELFRDRQFFIEHAHVSIEKKFTQLFDAFRNAERTLVHTVQRIDSQIGRLSDTILNQASLLSHGYERLMREILQGIDQSEKILKALDPVGQLSRGYSIVRHKGKVVRSVKEVKRGEELDITMSDGIIHSHTL